MNLARLIINCQLQKIYLHEYFPFRLTNEAQAYAETLQRRNSFQHCGDRSCNPSSAGESISNVMNATSKW